MKKEARREKYPKSKNENLRVRKTEDLDTDCNRQNMDEHRGQQRPLKTLERITPVDYKAEFNTGDRNKLIQCHRLPKQFNGTQNLSRAIEVELFSYTGFTLNLTRKIDYDDVSCKGAQIFRHEENQLLDYDLQQLSGKRVGIVGLGRIGSAIAKRAEAFGCSIAYYSRSKKPDVSFIYHSNLIDLAASSDVLVVACSLTKDTRHIINKSVLDALGTKGTLVNIGRGSLIDEKELVKALVEGRIQGAGLDVFENEPHVPEELYSLENVVLVPHVGSGTWETRKGMADLVVGNLEAHFLKKPLLTPVPL